MELSLWTFFEIIFSNNMTTISKRQLCVKYKQSNDKIFDFYFWFSLVANHLLNSMCKNCFETWHIKTRPLM